MSVRLSSLIVAALLSILSAGCSRQPAIDAGVPVYPGARNVSAETFSSRLKPIDRERLVKMVRYETEDPVTKVTAFYKEKLGGKVQVLERTTGGSPAAVIRAEIGGKSKFLMITANEDTEKTEILIGDIAEPPK